MKITKFGGSSLANAFQIQKVCNIVLSDEARKVMVVSAPGKRTKDDIKVTDLLIAVAKARLAGNSYEEELKKVGILPNTVRVSIGTENIDDIIQDLDEAFKAIS